MRVFVLLNCLLVISKTNLKFSVYFLASPKHCQWQCHLWHYFSENKCIISYLLAWQIRMQKNLVIFSIWMEVCASYISTYWLYFQNKKVTLMCFFYQFHIPSSTWPSLLLPSFDSSLRLISDTSLSIVERYFYFHITSEQCRQNIKGCLHHWLRTCPALHMCLV
jgi:hypothetical protein